MSYVAVVPVNKKNIHISKVGFSDSKLWKFYHNRVFICSWYTYKTGIDQLSIKHSTILQFYYNKNDNQKQNDWICDRACVY